MQTAKRGAPLTPREFEVLNLLKEGHSQPLVAEMLGLQPQTVKNHSAIILRKLDAPNMVNAVYKVTKAGLLITH